MTIHFAPARDAAIKPFARHLIRRRPLTAANDNASSRRAPQVLEEALRHFGQFGLGAAHEARKQAEAAFFGGDRQSYDRWLEICRILDRHMALGVARSMEQKGGSGS